MSTIAAGTTLTTALVETGDTTGNLVIQTNGTTTAATFDTSQNLTVVGSVRTNNILDASGGNTATINSMTPTADSLKGFRNRIINGDMRIDQRNAGASATITANPQYTLDRWFAGVTLGSKISIQQNANSVTPPNGFTNYLGVTSLAATTPGTNDVYYLQQSIEGYNISDFGFGSVGALSVTISFWVRSSLTGTFGAVLTNASSNRSYPFNYTISSANTWTQITQTIPGDTTGTWLTDNSTGFALRFGLGAGSTYQGTAGAWGTTNAVTTTGAVSVVGTNNATFYITGVQLEVGSTATPFERRPYGTELQLCQRYYQHYVFASGGILPGAGVARNTTRMDLNSVLPVVMRATPTIATTNVGNIQVYDGGSSRAATAIADNGTTAATVGLNVTVASGLTEGRGGYLQASGATAGYTLSIEL